MDVWLIAVIACSFVFGLPLLIALIFCIVACCIGCFECKKSFCSGKKETRNTVSPHGGTVHVPPPAYPGVAMQPQSAPPPSYMGNNTAYPPGNDTAYPPAPPPPYVNPGTAQPQYY